MGATNIVHEFEHYDWRQGIRELQKEANEYYGHQEGYSGEINSISDFSVMTAQKGIKGKALDEFINKRMEHIPKRHAEVLDLGVIAYSIAKPVVIDYEGWIPPDIRPLFREYGKSALLLNERGSVVDSGTVAQLKQRASQKVMREKFKNDYYIVSKNTTRVFKVTGEGNLVKKTTRKSTDKYLVLPIHKYIVYGWAAE